MLEATIHGELTSRLEFDPAGAWYCTVYSLQARRAVRVFIRNEQQADLIRGLAKHDRLTVTGRLEAKGAIGSTGRALALVSIKANHIKIQQEVLL